MKIYITSFALAILAYSSLAQSNSDSVKNVTAPHSSAVRSNEPFNWVEVMPRFPGGDAKLLEFIARNIRYPASAMEKGIQGRVIVRFVVDENGDVKNVTVPKGMGIEGSCDEEAIRVVSSLPKWQPGTQKGIAVPVWYTLPVVYKLQTQAQMLADAGGGVIYSDTTDKPRFCKCDTVKVVQEMPVFRGGDTAMWKIISRNIFYPAEAREHGIQGIVYVRFFINEKGEVKNIYVPSGLGIGGGCDAEAARVVSILPPWIPAKQDGKPVPVWHVISVTFKLQ